MKRLLVSIIVLSLMLLPSTAFADKPVGTDANGVENAWVNPSSTLNCWTLKNHQFYDSLGQPLELGFDEFGYNYQAHMFNGTYDSSDRVLDGKYFGASGDYVDDTLTMKWSDEWLSNEDCDYDGKLDRGLVNGVAGGISLGWTTNHVEGDYTDANGDVQHYTYFVKIVYTNGLEPQIWDLYTVVQEVFNDPADGYTGLYSKAEPGPGLGHTAYNQP
jgi:hypothetical protein